MIRELMRPISAGILLLLGLCITRGADAAADAPLTLYGSDGAGIALSRRQWLAGEASVAPIVQALRASAEKALPDGPWSVVNKKHPLPGVDSHDYVSLAPYSWPNPKTPDHLPYIGRDGQRNPEFMEYDAQPFMDLTDHVYVLALAGYFTGDHRFSDRAAELMRVWFLDPATRMNPNLDHAQLIKGVSDGQKSGIIESRRLIMLIDAAAMLQAAGAWSPQEQAEFKTWIADFLHWLRTSRLGRSELTSYNNHGTWYDVQVVTYSLFTGDDDQARRFLEGEKRRIDLQFFPDGEMPFEQHRTRSYWYSLFNLNAMTQLADLAPRVGVDLWNYRAHDGSSLRAAYAYLIPFAVGEQKWIHQEIGGFSAKPLLVPLRRAEAAWHEPGYESVIGNLKGMDVPTDEDREHPLWPAGLNRLIYPARE
jgi:hypothetical protein